MYLLIEKEEEPNNTTSKNFSQNYYSLSCVIYYVIQRKIQITTHLFIAIILNFPFSSLNFIEFVSGDWKFGPYVCLFWLSVDYTASTASIFNLSILSLDRYWSITSPLRYLRRRTKKRALIMIMLAWFGASMWFIPVLGWNQILRKGPSHLPGNYYININYN